MGGAVADGLRMIAGSALLVAALGGVAVTMLGVGAINVLFIPFLVDDLGASPAWAGPLEGAQMLSMVLAGAVMARAGIALQRPAAVRRRHRRPGRLRRPPVGRTRPVGAAPGDVRRGLRS